MNSLSALGSLMNLEGASVDVTITKLPEVDMSPITSLFSDYGNWILSAGVNIISDVAPYVLGFGGVLTLFYLGKRLISRIGH